MKKQTFILIEPSENTWRERLTVIFYTLFGLKYHHIVSKECVEEMVERLLEEEK